MEESASFCAHSQQQRLRHPRREGTKWGRILRWKTLTFTQQHAAVEQPFSRHGDQTGGAPGKGPEVARNDAVGRERETTVEKRKQRRKQVEEGGGNERRGDGGGARGLSPA